jgi:hypothetical protein
MLVGIQDNHNANAEIAGELSDIENDSKLEYTDEEYEGIILNRE